MTSDNPKLQQLLALREASHTYCLGLKDIWLDSIKYYKTLKKQLSDQKKLDNAMLEIMKDQFAYLSEKFDSFYYDSPDLEKIYRTHRPDWEYFTAQDFNLLISSLLYLIEDRYYVTSPYGQPKGINLYHETLFASGEDIVGVGKIFVKCKLARGAISVSAIRNFFEAMAANVAEGYFFTTGTISKQGRDFAATANRSAVTNPLHLIDKPQLDQLLQIGGDILQCWRELDLTDGNSHTFDADFDAIWDRKEALIVSAKELFDSDPDPGAQLALF